MEAVKAQYNTDRSKMVISEYGRNIHKMIDYTLAEPNRERRNKLAHALITLMSNMNPQVRDTQDYKQKLWDHLFVMSNFKLDVDGAYPMPDPEIIHARPDSMSYPQSRIRFKFYGKNIVQMIEKAAEMEDGATKSGFINLIGSFMKNACKNFNEEMLADEEILAHLEMLSGGRIQMTPHDDVQFNALQTQQGNYYHKRNNNNNNNGGGRNKQNNNRNFRNGGNNNNRNNNRNFRNNNNRNRGT